MDKDDWIADTSQDSVMLDGPLDQIVPRTWVVDIDYGTTYSARAFVHYAKEEELKKITLTDVSTLSNLPHDPFAWCGRPALEIPSVSRLRNDGDRNTFDIGYTIFKRIKDRTTDSDRRDINTTESCSWTTAA